MTGTVPTLQIVIASTRPGRAGLPVAQWFTALAERHGAFEVEVIDLAEWNLPFMDEPNHPRLRRYVHPHTMDWSRKVDEGDAFVFVTPEYNFGLSAPLKNAIDFLHQEWHHKPVALVNYGGVSAGTRSASMLRQVATAVRMVPLFDAVSIPFVGQLIDEAGTFRATESMDAAAQTMLDELARMEVALRPMRAGRAP